MIREFHSIRGLSVSVPHSIPGFSVATSISVPYSSSIPSFSVYRYELALNVKSKNSCFFKLNDYFILKTVGDNKKTVFNLNCRNFCYL